MSEIERILKLDQAGEYGAINIYSAQLLIVRSFYKDIISKLEEMLLHEKEHFITFNNLLLVRSIRPFYLLKFWAIGGFILGFFTAIMGRKAIWICTDSVETAVLHHLEWQLEYLRNHDAEVHEAVLSIIADEESHQELGQINGKDSLLYKPIFFIVKRSTEFAIWLSKIL